MALPAEPLQPTPDSVQRYVASEIRSLLGRYQTSQEALAHAIGLTQPTLSQRLSSNTPFRLTELEAIARFFHREVADLLPPGGSRTGSFATLEIVPDDGEPHQNPLPFPPTERILTPV